MAFLNHRLVADARLRFGMRVLDLGSGTGYPALLGAPNRWAEGSVIGLDLAEQMLAVARRKATALGLANVTFRTGDVTALPFEAELVRCRHEPLLLDVSAGDSEVPPLRSRAC